MSTHIQTRFRPATIDDCYTTAQLMQIASDGVCDYIWTRSQAEFPKLTPLEIGAKRYAKDDGNFSYRNCTIAFESDRPDARAMGMMMAFQILPEDIDPPTPESEPAENISPQDKAILAPYTLEQPNSWYVCALAVFSQYRGQGIGTQFLQLAAEQAQTRNLPSLSLLCFEQNTGALKLYQRHGFVTVDRAQVVPHPLIHYTGDILLMTKAV